MGLKQHVIDTLRDIISRQSTTEVERNNAKKKLTDNGIDWKKPVEEKRNNTTHKANSFSDNNMNYDDIDDFLKNFAGGRYKEYSPNNYNYADKRYGQSSKHSNTYTDNGIIKKYSIKIVSSSDVLFLEHLVSKYVPEFTGFSVNNNSFIFQCTEFQKDIIIKVFSKNRKDFSTMINNEIRYNVLISDLLKL